MLLLVQNLLQVQELLLVPYMLNNVKMLKSCIVILKLTLNGWKSGNEERSKFHFFIKMKSEDCDLSLALSFYILWSETTPLGGVLLQLKITNFISRSTQPIIEFQYWAKEHHLICSNLDLGRFQNCDLINGVIYWMMYFQLKWCISNISLIIFLQSENGFRKNTTVNFGFWCLRA